MEDSQSNSSKVFSVRIVSIDSYMASPIPNIDACYSSFQGGKVNEVPVIRIYGSTPAGQKTCLHVHKAFPYLYVPCSDIPHAPNRQGDSYTNAISLALEKALKLKGSAGSKRQHVHGCSLVRARKFYGYHSLEELFVKIYLYYPHDVSRAANLLLGGEVFDKSLQPHEAHIPYILQFLIDYSLYGMGHVHLSKIKFRPPVPVVCMPRKFNCNRHYGPAMENSTCMSAEFEAGLSAGESLDSPVWISSTIPGDWMWCFSSEFEVSSDQGNYHIKRQSICELEGDATVDEILNQQFKTYTSLSQTSSDVKMVQSLFPIWEEEYERTGVHGAAIQSDPGKPLAEDVLKTLLRGLDFERKLTELYNESEKNLPPVGDNVKSESSSKCLTDEEILVKDRSINFDDTNKELLTCVVERKNGGSSSQSPSLCEEEVHTAPAQGKDAYPEILSANDRLSSRTIGTLDPKAADTEALGLLRWLATSQAAEDINSDDEFVHATILSPLLQAKIDKYLDKANMESESESQKECQDILDSVEEDFANLEGLKVEACHSIDCSVHSQSSSEIAQGDALLSAVVKSSGNSSKIETRGESKRKFQHQVLQTGCTTDKYKRKKLIWGSLPFVMTRKENDEVEAVGPNIAEAPVCGVKNCTMKFVAGNEGEGSDAIIKYSGGSVSEADNLVGSSVRDLMRKKRRPLISKQELGHEGVKIVYSQDGHEQENIILPKQLDFHAVHDDEHEDKSLAFVASRSLVSEIQTKFSEVHNFKSTSNTCVEVAYASSCNGPLLKISHPSSSETKKKHLEFPNTFSKLDSAFVIGHGETYSSKEFECKGMASAEAVNCSVHNSQSDISSGTLGFKGINLVNKRFVQKELTGSDSLLDSLIKHEMSAKHDYEHKSGNRSSSLAEQLNETLIKISKSMDISADTTILQNEKSRDLILGGVSSIILYDSSISIIDSTEVRGNLVSMSFSKKPPVLNWEDGAPNNALFSPVLSCHTSFVNRDNKHVTSGNSFDELLPFFEGECQEKKEVQNFVLPASDSNVLQKTIMGVPTHYQNDGSLLYLLTPVYSPPSADCVSRWLGCIDEDAIGKTDVQSAGLLSTQDSFEIGSHGSFCVYGNEVSVESHSVSHTIPIEDQVQRKKHQNSNSEFHPNHDRLQRLLLCEESNAKPNTSTDCSVDLSQISGPNERSRPTPLSQTGFRDPASTGAGQQLTMLSIEVQAESRGDLRPDPRFDAIKVIALAFQNDNDSAVEVHVLMYSNIESYSRSSDGLCENKMFYFPEEVLLLSQFIRIINSYDPDILMGWDVQGGSLGYLAERAAHLGIGLLNEISRTPSDSIVGARETEISNKKVFDAVSDEPLVAESAFVDQAVIEDEWGRTHASGVHVGGRIVLNIWRLMRNEVKLNMYTIEAVSEAVLRRKIPSMPHSVLTKWFLSGSGRARYRCIEYIVQKAKLNLEIMYQLDMINRTSELARVFGIDFFSVLSRGSQYRVESMFLRLAHTQNYLAISPGNQQVASQPAMECIPLVMEPESGFYADPVVVLDFQSLYPSMVIAYNLCFCTCLGNVSCSSANTLGVSSYSPDPHVLEDLKDKVLLTPNGVMYVPSKVRKGVLPRLLEEILSTRIMVKQAMKKLPATQQVLHRILNARQLALKLIANVTYGYTAAGFSGRMPCAELADSIVQCGRSTLEKAISLVNANDKWNARVIYGDTDSMFVLLKGRSRKEAFQIGREIASAVTVMNPDPVTLKLEKVYHPCFLLTKKRYVGYSYENADQIEPVFDAKGIETVRRDTCVAVAKIMEQSLRLFFEHQNISEIKGYLQRQWTRILSGRVSLQDFIFAKEVCLGTYSANAGSSLPPAAIVATKAMKADRRAEPRYGERVPYVVIHGDLGARLVDMVVDPLELLAIDSPYRLNDIYYINKQIIPALQRVFGLLGSDLHRWFSEMPRPGRDTSAKRLSYGSNPQRTRIDYYYLSKHCVLCDELVHGSTHICNKCSRDETAAATAIIGRTSKLEKEMQHLAAICRHCGGGDWLVESGVKCTSLACSVFYERRKVQKELQGISTIAADKGFYPKCMVECHSSQFTKMAHSPLTMLLLRRITLHSINPRKPSIFNHHFLKPYSTSSSPDTPPKPSSLSARMSFVFDQIDTIERERTERDQTLQRIRAWRLSKKPQQQNPEPVTNQNHDFESGYLNDGDSNLNLTENNNNGSVEVNKKLKVEVEVAHPWPEWIELMERLVQQNYFDHRRKDEDKMVQEIGFDGYNIGDDNNDVGIDFQDFKTVQNACINFGKDRFDIFRSLSKKDIQILVGYGCPSVDKKVVFSAKLLRKHVHLDEGDVCSNCNLRSSCERGYLLTNKEDEARTIDIMRVLLTYGFDPINGSVVNKSLLKQKSLRTVIRKLLHEVVKLSAVPIDPNLPPPVIKRPPPKVKQPPPTPKRRVGRDDVEMKKGDWLCPKCDFMNFAKNTVCLQCDAKRPKRQLLPGEWECPECNFLNYRRNMACFHCDCKRPPDEFIENKMEEREHIRNPRMERTTSRSEVSNAWNFDFDDNESDGADVAAFEYADPAAAEENSRLHAQARGGNFREPDDDLNNARRISRLPEREYSEPSHNRSGLGFDDFDDEDDVDSYELDTGNDSPAWNGSGNNFSGQGGSDFEDENFHNSRDRGRNNPPSHGKPSRPMRNKATFSGSDYDGSDIDSEEKLSVYPKWKSSHVADAGPRRSNRGTDSRGPSKRLSFGSDEENELDSDADEDFGSGRSKGNKPGFGGRNYKANFSGSLSEDDQPYSHGNRSRRNTMEPGGRRDNVRGREDNAYGRDTQGRSRSKMGDRRSSSDDGYYDRSSRRSNDRSGGSRSKMGDKRNSLDDGFNRLSRRSDDKNRGFRGNSHSTRGTNDRDDKRSFRGSKQDRFSNRQGRSRDNYVDSDKDFGEFKNSRRVIER
ncbi:DNA polymerase zeta catalytic subunit [Mercurialis annua]|uniref:DNA polymerase zeta catalytic subunit n=1 Tax=Mercurialis annua TaxID=3986 RepID=UPI00215F172B|nr:DNA polymerase zeta catalytic subunit [Mercurialis annua]